MTPKWAQQIIAAECAARGIPEPEMVWRHSKTALGSTGRCGTKRIVVTVAINPPPYWTPDWERHYPLSARADQKITLLHELAHWFTQGEHHSPRFWDVAWALFRRYNVPLRYAAWREGLYRKEATAAYRRSRGKA